MHEIIAAFRLGSWVFFPENPVLWAIEIGPPDTDGYPVSLNLHVNAVSIPAGVLTITGVDAKAMFQWIHEAIPEQRTLTPPNV